MKNRLFFAVMLFVGISSLYAMDPDKPKKAVSFVDLVLRSTALDNSDSEGDNYLDGVLFSRQPDYNEDESGFGYYCSPDEDDELIGAFGCLVTDNDDKTTEKSPGTITNQFSPAVTVGHRSPSVCTIGAADQSDIFSSKATSDTTVGQLCAAASSSSLLTDVFVPRSGSLKTVSFLEPIATDIPAAQSSIYLESSLGARSYEDQDAPLYKRSAAGCGECSLKAFEQAAAQGTKRTRENDEVSEEGYKYSKDELDKALDDSSDGNEFISDVSLDSDDYLSSNDDEL